MPDYAKIKDALAAVLRTPYAEAAGASLRGSLGEAYEYLSKLPGYFSTGPGATPGGLDALGARHGVRVLTGLNKSMPGVPDYAVMSGGNAAFMDSQNTMGSLIQDLQQRDPRLAAVYTDLLKQGKVNPGTQMYGIDTMANKLGTGGGRGAYGAAYDILMQHPDAANYPATGLTESNTVRRSLNMAGAMEKHGQAAADRIMVSPSQLDLDPGGQGAANYALMHDYNQLPFEQQLGMMNALPMSSTVNRVNKAMNALKGVHSQGGGEADPLMTEAASLGTLDKWTPSTDVDPQYYGRLSDLLTGVSKLTGTPQEVGIDSLRRAGISNDVLTQGLTGADLKSQPYLWQGLAKRHGGVIPVSTPGALSQTYGCAT